MWQIYHSVRNSKRYAWFKSEGNTAQRNNKKGHQLNTLAQDQILSRLSIALAQLQAGKELKQNKKRNKTTTIFAILLKIITKKIYKHLIKII